MAETYSNEYTPGVAGRNKNIHMECGEMACVEKPGMR
jgi:hypothetical protein